jgi:hypothetical protein
MGDKGDSGDVDSANSQTFLFLGEVTGNRVTFVTFVTFCVVLSTNIGTDGIGERRIIRFPAMQRSPCNTGIHTRRAEYSIEEALYNETKPHPG